MKKVCVVPARGGSKRLHNKNILPLNGKPLIYHSIDIIIDYFDLVIVPSDSSKILDLASNHPSDRVISIQRPAYLASDTSKVLETVNWMVDNHLPDDTEQVWLCLPTCPLRSAQDVEGAQKLLTEDIDGIVSVTDFEFPPTLGLNIDSGNFLSDNNPLLPFVYGNTRSQDHPTVYRPNGAMYGMWLSSFKNNRNFFKGSVKGYYMPRNRSIDIDTALDFQIAEILLKI